MTKRQGPIDIAASLKRENRKQFERDPDSYRQMHRGRGGTGAGEVDAWWPEIDKALKAHQTQRRIWEFIRNLKATDLGDMPALTIGYATFCKHVKRRQDGSSADQKDGETQAEEESHAQANHQVSGKQAGAKRAAPASSAKPSIIDQITRKTPRPRD